MITLTVNGCCRDFERQLNISQLIDRLALTGKKLAVEHNGDLVPRSRFDEEILAHGDQVEIVIAVGGG